MSNSRPHILKAGHRSTAPLVVELPPCFQVGGGGIQYHDGSMPHHRNCTDLSMEVEFLGASTPLGLSQICATVAWVNMLIIRPINYSKCAVVFSPLTPRSSFCAAEALAKIDRCISKTQERKIRMKLSPSAVSVAARSILVGLFSIVMVQSRLSAQAVATQTLQVDISAFTGTGGWFNSLLNIVNGTNTVLNATPTVFVTVDASGNHSVSAGPNMPTAVTITRANGQFEISLGPDSVVGSITTSTESMPEEYSWEIKVDPATNRVVVEIEITEDGITTRYPVDIAQVSTEILSIPAGSGGNGEGGSGSGGGSGGGGATMDSYIYIIIGPVPVGEVIIGPITPLPGGGGAGAFQNR